jgi:hypothetical protein
MTLRNQGQDAHQAVISRANDGVTRSYTEILALPTDQQLQLTTVLGLVQADPGQTDTVFLRLTPAMAWSTSSRRARPAPPRQAAAPRTTPSAWWANSQ